MTLRMKSILELWSITCHTGSHSSTCYLKWVNAPGHNPIRQARTQCIYLRGMKAELTLVLVSYIQRWFTCLQTVIRPSTNHTIVTQL